MPALSDATSARIRYIPQQDRTVIVRVERPGEAPFDFVADVYSDEELAAVKAPRAGIGKNDTNAPAT